MKLPLTNSAVKSIQTKESVVFTAGLGPGEITKLGIVNMDVGIDQHGAPPKTKRQSNDAFIVPD